MKATGNGRHNDLVLLVEEELMKRGYTNIHKLIEYSTYTCGELDIYATKDNYVLLFECKCNKTKKSYSKAVDQLDRASHAFFKNKAFPRDYNKRVFKFLAYNKNKEVMYEWIRA